MTTTTTDLAVTMTAKELGSLFRPVLPHACTDDYLPVLAAVLLTSGDGWLAATATDRYTIATQRVKVKGVKPGIRVILPIASVKSLLTTFGRVTKANNPESTVTFGDERLQVEAAGTIMGGFSEARFSIALHQGDYPAISSIYDRSNVKPSTGAVAYNPKLLARFGAAQTEGEPLVITPAGTHAALVTVGEDFVGALMPARTSMNEDGTATQDISGWGDVFATLAAVQKAPAKRRGGRRSA